MGLKPTSSSVDPEVVPELRKATDLTRRVLWVAIATLVVAVATLAVAILR